MWKLSWWAQTQARTQTNSKILVAVWPLDKAILLPAREATPLDHPSTRLLHLKRDIFSESKGFRKNIDPLILIDQLKCISHSRVTSSHSLYITRCRASAIIMRDFWVKWRWAGQAIGHLQSGNTVISLPLSDSCGAAAVVLNHRWLWHFAFFSPVELKVRLYRCLNWSHRCND